MFIFINISMKSSPHAECVALKDYIDSNITAIEKRLLDSETYRATMQAQVDKALDLANSSVDKRLAVMNEFRAAMQDQQIRFVVKDEYNTRHDALDTNIRTLEKVVAENNKANYPLWVSAGVFSLILGTAILGPIWAHFSADEKQFQEIVSAATTNLTNLTKDINDKYKELLSLINSNNKEITQAVEEHKQLPIHPVAAEKLSNWEILLKDQRTEDLKRFKDLEDKGTGIKK